MYTSTLPADLPLRADMTQEPHCLNTSAAIPRGLYLSGLLILL
jgi:hypothetical protein